VSACEDGSPSLVGPTSPARLSDDAAVALLEGGDLLSVGARADAERRRLHPGDDVTFIVDRNINYTDYCISGCRFCAFFKTPGSGQGYLLDEDEIHRKVEETLALGGTAIMMQGGLHPDLDICWFERVFSGIKARYPIHIHSLSPPEIVHIAKVSGLSVEETLRRLRAAGLDSLPGGGAEVLVDRVRLEISPHKIPTDTWLGVMRTAHGLGMKTTATMMFGSLDTVAERVEHLSRIRELQDETGGFTAFIPWTFQAGNTELAAGHVPATGLDYLRMLAVSRIYLDNVPNIQASWVTQGLRMGQVALAFGANDMGSTMIEENVVAAAGVRNQCDVPQMVRLIRAAGRIPVQRDTLYREVRRY
jgi:cyclic dehypoxanthinyl futalosine synthase